MENIWLKFKRNYLIFKLHRLYNINIGTEDIRSLETIAKYAKGISNYINLKSLPRVMVKLSSKKMLVKEKLVEAAYEGQNNIIYLWDRSLVSFMHEYFHHIDKYNNLNAFYYVLVSHQLKSTKNIATFLNSTSNDSYKKYFASNTELLARYFTELLCRENAWEYNFKMLSLRELYTIRPDFIAMFRTCYKRNTALNPKKEG